MSRRFLVALMAVAAANASEFLTFEEDGNACGDKRPGGLPDPAPGTCNDIGKCCDWTWPPMLTGTISCDATDPGSCYGCEAPSCCCQAGTLVLNIEDKIAPASCCDCFFTSGPNKGKICEEYPPTKCGDNIAQCKTFGDADCDKCGNYCIEFDDKPCAFQFV